MTDSRGSSATPPSPIREEAALIWGLVKRDLAGKMSERAFKWSVGLGVAAIALNKAAKRLEALR